MIDIGGLRARDYEQITPEGPSGNSHVFRAYHPRHSSPVAIKCLNQLSSAAFQQEIAIMQRLNGHPNIRQLHDYFQTSTADGNTLLWIVMEGGKSLMKDMIDRKENGKPYSGEEFTDIVFSSIQVFAHMEKLQIVHRSITPQCLYIHLTTGTVKLGNFECATYLNRDYTIVGTPAYMSPELRTLLSQGMQGAQHNQVKSDVYSLGQTLLAVGNLEPMREIWNLQNLYQTVSEMIVKLPFSEEIKEFIGYMVEPEPERRWTFEQLNEKCRSLTGNPRGQFLALPPSPAIPPESVQSEPHTEENQWTVFSPKSVQSESHAEENQRSDDYLRECEQSPSQFSIAEPNLATMHLNSWCCLREDLPIVRIHLPCNSKYEIFFRHMKCYKLTMKKATVNRTQREIACPVCEGRITDIRLICANCEARIATYFIECGHLYCNRCLKRYNARRCVERKCICLGCEHMSSATPKKIG